MMTTRRRFVSIVAACGAAGPLLAGGAHAAPDGATVWRGTALGAPATMTLVHPDRARARAAIVACVDEIARLEAVFSLYRRDSALSRLNAAGELRDPPHELVELLAFALALSRRSGGAFDPTVQPLYRLYADHHAAPRADPAGPPARAIARVLRSVDASAVELDARRIRYARAGMAVTLNGVAQGFLGDRVAARLRAAGFEHVLIDLGEARALGRRADGEAWRAAVADPSGDGRTLVELPLGDAPGAHGALSTSAGSGTRFGTDPRIHHLLDPHTGRSANHWRSVSVAGPSATLADGLSTALALLAPARAMALADGEPGVRVWFVDATGRVVVRGTAG